MDEDEALVPFEPSADQKKRFDDAMQTMKGAGSIGLALYNWANSDLNTLEVVHIPGKTAGEVNSMAYFDEEGHRKLWKDTRMPGGGKNPAIGVDLGEVLLCPIPPDIKFKTEIPPSAAITLVHELGHVIIGLQEGEDVVFVENPARQALGFDDRKTYRGKDVEKWDKEPVNRSKSYVDNVSQAVKSFITEWAGGKNEKK